MTFKQMTVDVIADAFYTRMLGKIMNLELIWLMQIILTEWLRFSAGVTASFR